MIYLYLIIVLLCCIIGMIIDRTILLKWFLCYDLIYFIILLLLILLSIDINTYIILCYLLWNSTIEVVIGLSILSLNISIKNVLINSIESSKGIYTLYINHLPYWTTSIFSNDYLSLYQINKFSRYINYFY